MSVLIDTNIIVRFFVGGNPVHIKKSKDIFSQIENNALKVEILDAVIMECLFVLIKTYQLNPENIMTDLKNILAMSGVVGDKHISIEALNIMQSRSIDYVDALICAKHKLQGYDKISFDKKVIECWTNE